MDEIEITISPVAMDKMIETARAEGRAKGFLSGLLTGAAAVVMLVAASVAFAQVPRRAEAFKRDLIREARAQWGLDAPVASFAAQIHQESGWNPDARSRVGALGLTQFMPATAAWISGLDPRLHNAQPMDPQWAIRALVQYDTYLYKKLPAINECEQLAFSMSAYNGGLGWALKRRAAAPARGVKADRCFNQACDINPGISAANQIENQEYPRRILLKYEPLYVAAGWGPGFCESYATRFK